MVIYSPSFATFKLEPVLRLLALTPDFAPWVRCGNCYLTAFVSPALNMGKLDQPRRLVGQL